MRSFLSSILGAADIPGGYPGAAQAVAEQQWRRVGVPGSGIRVCSCLDVHLLRISTSAKIRNMTTDAMSRRGT